MAWTMPRRREGADASVATSPLSKMALYTRTTHTWELLNEIFTSLGITIATLGLDPMQIDEVEHDSVFVKMEMFEQIPALCPKLLGRNKPPCLVLFSEKKKGRFFKAISDAENVILIRRPLAVHRLSQCLKEPWKYMGSQNLPMPPGAAPDSIEKLAFTSERQIEARNASVGKILRWETEPPSVETSAPLEQRHAITAVEMPEKQRVLMVEDNEINGKMALKLLSIAGYDPELAVDGAVALEKITAPDNHYDVILMDCQVSFSLSVLMPDAGHGWP
jgi:hypothetical protein